MLIRIACHNIFPISNVHTIPIDRCVFLYALIIDGSICFPSLFIQTTVEVHRNKSRKHCLLFPIFISRILAYLELEDFPSSNYVHLIKPIGSSFLKEWNAQKKTVDEVDIDIADAEPTVPPPLSLHAMMETFMMTQAAHGQLLNELITKVAALRADFNMSIEEFFHLLHPLIFDGCLWQYVTEGGVDVKRVLLLRGREFLHLRGE